MTEAKRIGGWLDLPDWAAHQKEGKCCVCERDLPKRRRRFCAEECRRAYFWNVWKGAHWTKRVIVMRDGPACRACGEVFERPSSRGGAFPDWSTLELDHVLPLFLGGSDHPDNMQILCTDCHKRKSIAERAHTSKARP